MVLILLVLAFVLFLIAAVLAWVPVAGRNLWAVLVAAGLAAWVLATILGRGTP